MSNEEATARFHELLDENDILVAPGIFHALDARIAEMTGNDVLHISGASTNIGLYGEFDGLIGLSEMVENARRITDAVDLPVVVDADTGYGGPNNVQRTVRQFEKAGVAAMHIEDQVWPKRCGHAAGKEVVSLTDARSRFKAAVDAKTNEDTVIMARTDAYGSANGTWEDHVERGRAYLDAGVDMVWPEMPDPGRDDAVRFAEAIHETHPDADLAFNYSPNFKWSEVDDPLTFDELADLGYRFTLMGLAGLLANTISSYEHFKDIAENEEEAQIRMEEQYEGHEFFESSTDTMWKVGKFDEFQAVEEEYLENFEEKYGDSEGYQFD